MVCSSSECVSCKNEEKVFRTTEDTNAAINIMEVYSSSEYVSCENKKKRI